MLNLIGVYDCTVDAKGRLMLPSSLKKQMSGVLGDGFVIKRSVFHQCLELYPMSEYNALLKDINRLNRFVKANNDWIRRFNMGIRTLELDNAGRLLIPKDLIMHAGIEKNIVMSSAVNMIEIWDKERYEKVVNDSSVDFEKLTEEVMGKLGNKNELP